MTERIVVDSNGRKHITNEPQLHPPQCEWVGLTDEEIVEVANAVRWSKQYHVDFARAIESLLWAKNS